MKVVILAGGLGSRLSEETHLIPKPLVSIGEFPIIMHIMNIYSHYGYNDFIICLGYKGNKIKEYFLNYMNIQADLTVDLKNNEVTHINRKNLDWKITLIDTGKDSMTGGRIAKVVQQLDEPFHCTYGDGLGDINIEELVNFHKNSKTKSTVTAVRPPARFGSLKINDSSDFPYVESFSEKPLGDSMWINGGFFIFDPSIFEKSIPDDAVLETDILPSLVQDKELSVYKHESFWHPMDTIRDKNILQELWESGKAPWKM